MIQRFLTSLVALALLLGASMLCYAQAPTPALGDYGSIVTGAWDSVSTWKMYSANAAFDSAVTGAPSSGRNVFILTGTTVTYQTSSQNCKNLVVQAGATLQSSATLPTGAVYLKINGNTVWIDGNFGSGPTDALSLETKYNGTITIGGSGVINIAQLRPNSGQSGTMVVVFASNANINYAGSSGNGGAGIYTSRGTQTSSTITVNPGVTITFARGSHFEMTSNTSNLGTMTTTLNVDGTLDASHSSVLLADSAAYTATLNVGTAGVVKVGDRFWPYLTGGGIAVINVAAGGSLEMMDSCTADFSNPDSKVEGAGSFILHPGATIKVGAPAGLDSAAGPIRTAIATFDTLANYSYVGNGLQVWGKQMPDSVHNLTIGATSIDSVTAPKKVKGILQIDGLLINNGGLTTLDTGIVNGTYQHNTTSGAMPIAKWNTGSLCLVTGMVTTGSSGIANGNQNFYNFTVDCAAQTGAGRLGFDGNTISGNLVYHNTNDPTGAAVNYVALQPKNGGVPITLLGNLLVDSSAACFSIGSGSTITSQTLIVHGNIISKGSIFLNGSGVSNKLFAMGDIRIENAGDYGFRGHSSAANADTVVFLGTGVVQRFTKPVVMDMDNLQFVVKPGATVYLDDTTIVKDSGTLLGTFTADSASTLIFGHPGGVDSNLACSGALNLSRYANYEFNSLSAQVTGSKFPPVVNSLTINDSLGVTLSATDTVTSTLALVKGRFSTGANNLVVGTTGSIARTAGYVDGNLQQFFAAVGAKDFPVGTENGYSPVSVNVTAGSGAMMVKAVQGQHPNSFDTTKTLARYWTLTADTSIHKADLAFSYLAGDVHGNEAKYGAWRYSGTGTAWSDLTSFNHPADHMVSTPNVTSFSDWTLGESALATDVKAGNSQIPTEFFVNQNYPNPFNPTTTITYGLPHATRVSIKIYSVLGQEVATLVAGEQEAGLHTLTFDGSRLASGVYLYRVATDESVQIKRMLLVK